ncbi:MAG: type II toxin-antitoxin system RelE/ParE family toxin [Pseudohongiella nitratireducens]|nr:type II toxin-antitoxin system RelE/ParE family toxin [Pseudohongiella nitratireducens]
MKTVVETSIFQRKADALWSGEEREDFILHVATNPFAGDVVPGSGGVRKLRWTYQGAGKRGGVRVIYFYRTVSDEVWLLKMYAKNERENIPAHELRRIKEAIGD